MALRLRSGRSREGAWIEISSLAFSASYAVGRSREGAWIEIVRLPKSAAGITGRSREGAWIEIVVTYADGSTAVVAPVRERGLKSLFSDCRRHLPRSLP